jgi:hypothetical protein
VGVWKPTKDGQLCTKHGETFPKGRVCSLCPIDRPTVEEVAAAEAARPPMASSVPSTADHEEAFAQDAARWAGVRELLLERVEKIVARKKPRKGDEAAICFLVNSAAKAQAELTKARRAGAARADKREDWEATEKLERAARELDQFTGPMRVRTAASEVHH